MKDNLRQEVHDHMAEIAARHAGIYAGMAGDGTATQLFALLTDTALACLMEAGADLTGPGPGPVPGRRLRAHCEGHPAHRTRREPGPQERQPRHAPGQRVARLAHRERRGRPPAMTASQPGYRIALVRTGDPGTRLRPGDQGTVPRRDSGSALSMHLHDGDRVRLITPAPGEAGEPGR